ncbi:MAG: hypothetical protein WC792_00615 [Candidatus Micrarchaeia archaeon]|jgi:uncharacterized membrane protein YhfC
MDATDQLANQSWQAIQPIAGALAVVFVMIVIGLLWWFKEKLNQSFEP